MFDEREFIARFEKASIDMLVDILSHPDRDQDQALRGYLGVEQYRRLRSLALRHRVSRSSYQPRGNVVVIHCFMGSALSTTTAEGTVEQIWVNARQLMNSQFARLRLSPDGRNEFNAQDEIRVTGMMKRYYGELLLSLSERWNVRSFWYDWRKSVRTAAAQLEARVNEWFNEDEPFHIVAHGMGGLVARAFVLNTPERWAAMRDPAPGMANGGRLIMLGTPNHGSFVVPQVLSGLSHLVSELQEIDLQHDRTAIMNIVHSFVGLYQMLPSPFIERDAAGLYQPVAPDYVNQTLAALYQAATYDSAQLTLRVSQPYLDAAYQLHSALRTIGDPERMLEIAGDTFSTPHHLTDPLRTDAEDAYAVSAHGDGFTTFDLSRLGPAPAFTTYYVAEQHGNLTTSPTVLAALDELLTTGTTTALSAAPLSSARSGDSAALQPQLRQAHTADLRRLQAMLRPLTLRSGAANGSDFQAAEERKVEGFLTRDILGYREAQPASKPKVTFQSKIALGLVHGNIVDAATLSGDQPPVDVLAVGHYRNVRPYSALLALDQALHVGFNQQVGLPADQSAPRYLYPLTQFVERGIIGGNLGEPFFLPDPRQQPGATQRLIALVGMGQPGRFGEPELMVLARELCWTLGQLTRRHLATVLIGAGNGNLPVRKAVDAWIRGIKAAVTGSSDAALHQLRRITFVELDPRRIAEIDRAIQDQQERLRQEERLEIDYTPLSEADLARLEELSQQHEFAEWQAERQRRKALRDRGAPAPIDSPDVAPSRVTLWLDDSATYRFGAITETAAIPERTVVLDPKLVQTANDELVREYDLEQQRDRGQFLANLLLPDDLREHMFTNAPLVMILDRTTARIHWEMLTPGDIGPSRGDGHDHAEFEDVFLGTSRGLTRQFRTVLAPPRDTPPPPRRLLRVLVIADPAADMRLPGAEEEGAAIADLFEAFNSVYETTSQNRIEVVRLFGPYEATRTTVLRNLMERSFNLVHFCGHCVYDLKDPSASGWIFSDGERLTAREISRIDRVPSFLFSNACESGVTPERSEDRSVDLAPSFAESFFARGVANFVCTAWPVADLAARDFALTLYERLLGMRRDDNGRYSATFAPEAMHVAMRAARRAIAFKEYGARTWGAYQHYGNPYFRLFDGNAMRAPAPAVVDKDA